jgi:DNA-binding CsgD family transcriptional regulator
VRIPDDPIAVVEAAYDLDADPTRWLAGVASTLQPAFDAGLGLAAHTFDASDPARLRWGEPVLVGGAERVEMGTHDPLASAMAALLVGGGSSIVTVSEQTGLGEAFATWTPAEPLRARLRARDVLALKIADPTRRGIVVLAPLPAVESVPPAARATWSCLASHVAAGARLRHSWSRGDEAVLDEDGRVLHAEGLARGASAREQLRDAVRRQHRARGALRRLDPAQALDVWRGLVAGRWSVVERFDTDGRRFLVARKNDPDVPPDPRGLTVRERQVLGYVGLGQSNRDIAYALGLAPSTVSEHVASGLRKLGLRGRAEAARLLGGG